ncbi:MAG: twin-arginine translocation signal domain-containing protein [Akkermansiaceae bacterium]
MIHTRRSFLKSASAASVVGAPAILTAKTPIFGQKDFRYRVVKDWGVLDEKTPVNNCHGIVTTGDGHLVLLTDEVRNNVIIYDQTGRLVGKWGMSYPGAHGLSLVVEGDREVLFITDLKKNLVEKTTLDGEVL